MPTDPNITKPEPYRVVGVTYDDVKVLAPAIKSKRFTAAAIRRLIRYAAA